MNLYAEEIMIWRRQVSVSCFHLHYDLVSRDKDGARISDGRPVPSGSFTELFLHGHSIRLGVNGDHRDWRDCLNGG